jgi:ketosteroid isomerase-like protein
VSEAIEVVRRFVRMVEERAPFEAIAELLHEDVVQREWPNKLFPRGAQRDRAAMGQASQRGRQALSAERYEVRHAAASGETVALQIEWSGTLAVPYGEMAVGHVLRAHIAMFFQVRDGRIASIENYDCYET